SIQADGLMPQGRSFRGARGKRRSHLWARFLQPERAMPRDAKKGMFSEILVTILPFALAACSGASPSQSAGTDRAGVTPVDAKSEVQEGDPAGRILGTESAAHADPVSFDAATLEDDYGAVFDAQPEASIAALKAELNAFDQVVDPSSLARALA